MIVTTRGYDDDQCATESSVARPCQSKNNPTTVTSPAIPRWLLTYGSIVISLFEKPVEGLEVWCISAIELVANESGVFAAACPVDSLPHRPDIGRAVDSAVVSDA